MQIVNLVNALASQYLDYLKESNKLIKENEELNKKKEAADQNFNSLASELEKVNERVGYHEEG